MAKTTQMVVVQYNYVKNICVSAFVIASGFLASGCNRARFAPFAQENAPDGLSTRPAPKRPELTARQIIGNRVASQSAALSAISAAEQTEGANHSRNWQFHAHIACLHERMKRHSRLARQDRAALRDSPLHKRVSPATRPYVQAVPPLGRTAARGVLRQMPTGAHAAPATEVLVHLPEPRRGRSNAGLTR
jgi:hypothetical protein